MTQPRRGRQTKIASESDAGDSFHAIFFVDKLNIGDYTELKGCTQAEHGGKSAAGSGQP